MVRINIIAPLALADQHLIAEYNEILMLEGYVLKHPEPIGIPSVYCLGPGHIKFFKNKLIYISTRHDLIKSEMRDRGFKPEKALRLDRFPTALHNDWTPTPEAIQLIKERLGEKLLLKPDWYRYRGKYVGVDYLLGLIRQS